MIRIKAVGDIMPGGILNKRDVPFVSQEVLEFLRDADIRVGTLECAIGDDPDFCPIKKAKGSSAFVYAEDSDLKRLLELDINVVSLANNHFFDLGDNGTVHTIKMLDAYGILHCGAGRNLCEAQEPAVIYVNGETVAFVGFCDKVDRFCRFATDTTPGVNPLDEGNILKVVQEAKAKYDYVFAIVHWGKEHTFWPRPSVKRYARILRKAGVAGIIGGHPHRVQSVLRINRCPVAYSLGNFLFPDRYINTPYTTYYPSDLKEIYHMKSVYGFTRVQTPSLKLWPAIANIGMILTIDCENQSKTTFKFRLTEINRSGYVDFNINPHKIIVILTLIRLVIVFPFYKCIVSVSEFSKTLGQKCFTKAKRILRHCFGKIRK